MRIKLKVTQPTRKYKKFCRLFLIAIKQDMIQHLNRRKLLIRKKYLDDQLDLDLDYYLLYIRFIQSMYLSWDNDSKCYCINLDDSIKIRKYRIIFIWKMIEYGVGELSPYPFIRESFWRYRSMLQEIYDNFCKEGRIDLSLRRSDNRRSKISIRR